MMPSNLTNEEKRRLSNQRKNAVRNAWKEEKTRIGNGQGTREWTLSEQKELLDKGSVSGYEGHHMKSVHNYPDQAENPKNIQFLSEDEHFYGAHQGSYHNVTNGYYDPKINEMIEFQDEELVEVPINDLSEKYVEDNSFELDRARQKYTSSNMEDTLGHKQEPENLSSARSEYINSLTTPEASGDRSNPNNYENISRGGITNGS